jgi:hypothetical protein
MELNFRDASLLLEMTRNFLQNVTQNEEYWLGGISIALCLRP